MNILARSKWGVDLDPQRLRYLTENLTGLQGLNFVLLGALFLLLAMEDVYGSSWPIRGWRQALIGGAVIVAMRYTPRYYLQRFGHVEPRNPSNMQIAIFILVLVVLYFSRRSLDRYANDLTQVIHSMISDPGGQVRLFPLLLWIGSLSTTLVKRSLRMIERIYFLCLGTLACAAIALYPFWHPEATQELLWRTLHAGSFGLSIMALGLYDHISLVRMLSKTEAGNDDE